MCLAVPLILKADKRSMFLDVGPNTINLRSHRVPKTREKQVPRESLDSPNFFFSFWNHFYFGTCTRIRGGIVYNELSVGRLL